MLLSLLFNSLSGLGDTPSMESYRSTFGDQACRDIGAAPRVLAILRLHPAIFQYSALARTGEDLYVPRELIMINKIMKL
ncbi:hypothetical protein GALL_477530 [mine drainage metagenome]|uniref:Uncharacterized protein n=1 Tax=mine drainage metagenome TaxID=410659 RepID=A0A1J5PGS3_9ZZZZ